MIKLRTAGGSNVIIDPLDSIKIDIESYYIDGEEKYFAYYRGNRGFVHCLDEDIDDIKFLLSSGSVQEPRSLSEYVDSMKKKIKTMELRLDKVKKTSKLKQRFTKWLYS